jgi:hypothetical protein
MKLELQLVAEKDTLKGANSLSYWFFEAFKLEINLGNI